jgi:hypothetical protein
MSFPDLSLFYMSIYGGFGFDYGACFNAYLGLAAGQTQSGNPPYSITDFLSLYPQFAGPASVLSSILDQGATGVLVGSIAGMNLGQLVTGGGINPGSVIANLGTQAAAFTCSTTTGSAGLTNVSSTTGLLAGMPIAGAGIPVGATIAGVGTNTLMLSAAATASADDVATQATQGLVTLSQPASTSGPMLLTFYLAPVVPLATIQVFLNLAYASLMSSRWRESWTIGMGLYIAHYVTLWMQAASGAPTAAGVVTAGLQRGILVSKSADGLSAGLQAVGDLDTWSAFNLTSYGVLLATMAKSIGAGMIYVR